MFAFLSEYEGFGLTPVEAMSAGVPALVLDTEVAREIYGEAAVYLEGLGTHPDASVRNWARWSLEQIYGEPFEWPVPPISDDPRVLARRLAWDESGMTEAELVLLGATAVGPVRDVLATGPLDAKLRAVNVLRQIEQGKTNSEAAAALGISFEEQKQRSLEKVSMRTMVSPQDIANMALYLASAAGRHVTGQAISVCAGVEMLG